jgi:branched-chain amino acid transport system ATP-binding protein
MAGLNLAEVDEALRLLRQINDDGVTLIVVEHLMKAIMLISTTVVVLAEGKVIAQGTAAQVTRSQAVIEAYLGSRFAKRQAQLAEIEHQAAVAEQLEHGLP